jgi:hypothetical protein
MPLFDWDEIDSKIDADTGTHTEECPGCSECAADTDDTDGLTVSDSSEHENHEDHEELRQVRYCLVANCGKRPVPGSGVCSGHWTRRVLKEKR